VRRMSAVRSESRYLQAQSGPGAPRLAKDIDESVAALSENRDVITVSVIPLTTTRHEKKATAYSSRLGTAKGTGHYGHTYTGAVIVTVVWREP